MSFLRQGGCADFLLFKQTGITGFLFLQFIFLLGSGEEISWDKRIFGWETSEGYGPGESSNGTKSS
jgi:hypothetical protein